MDMKLLDKNIIECVIPIDELESRWNATVQDIIFRNEKGKSVIDFLVTQSRRKFNINTSKLCKIDIMAPSNGLAKFIIKWKEQVFGNSEDEGMEDTSVTEGKMGEDSVETGTPTNTNVFPTVCYGYTFNSMYEVISVCNVIPIPKCVRQSSLCKEKEKYILIITTRQDFGDAIHILMSEFSEEYTMLYSSHKDTENQHKLVHGIVLDRYSPESIIIDSDAIEKLSDIYKLRNFPKENPRI